MKIIVCENYEEMSRQAAKIVSSQLIVKPNSILGLATGSTPIGLYQNLIEMNQKGEIDFSEVKTFNLDEYYPIKKSNDQSYDYFMNEQLFSKVNID
ncbi:MAG: glucosamine-6-phosphate deaminase, partial [Clostridia bacterium]|nr:glucosamine-6-phosphate deaminase [Clostridia bacterium]